MVALGESYRNVTANDGSKGAAFGEQAHVEMNHKQADGKQSRSGMDDDRQIAQKAEVPREIIRKPKHHAAQKQQGPTPEEPPKEELLARVVAAGRRHLVILVRAVITNGLPPGLVDIRMAHLPGPHRVHVEDRADENQPCPGMQHSRNLSAAEDGGDPETPGRPK